MTRTLAIAANTVREALRERLMYNLVVFAVVLIGGSLTISQLTLGEQYRIIADVGASSTQVFGTLIAIFMGVGLIAREMDRRTCYPVLARPVSRASFILGKYLGLMTIVALNLVVMCAANAAALYAYAGPGQWMSGTFLAVFALLYVQFAIGAAFAVLFSSFTTATLATIFTLSLVAAGHVFAEVRSFWLRSDLAHMKSLVHVLDFVLPNMGLLDLKEALTYGDPVAAASIGLRGGYGLLYAGVMVALAALVFTRRDVR
jgi:Cu-processing system permease protein